MCGYYSEQAQYVAPVIIIPCISSLLKSVLHHAIKVIANMQLCVHDFSMQTYCRCTTHMVVHLLVSRARRLAIV